jgi:hypothetical protein
MEAFPWITVVSGLPRSGTSLMMQALAAGGLPPLTDGRRVPDASNSRGYLEFEAVKHLRTDRSWLPEARGRAVKIIHLLLPELLAAAGGNEFRIVLMRRPIEEVVASQRAMLTRQGRAGAALPDEQLGALFADQMERAEDLLAGLPEFRMCAVHYPALVAEPKAEVAQVNAFLDGKLDETAMAGAVDSTLYHERIGRPVE